MSTFTRAQVLQIAEVAVGLADIDNLPAETMDKLMEFYMPQMPYGTAKARDGDPYEFITDALDKVSEPFEFFSQV